MTVWLCFICCVAGLFLLFGWRRKRVTPQAERAIIPSASPYRSVSIGPDKKGCGSAGKPINQRFLAREAPRLPLPDCIAIVCQYRNSHFDDRRDEDRRNSHALRRGLRLIRAIRITVAEVIAGGHGKPKVVSIGLRILKKPFEADP